MPKKQASLARNVSLAPPLNMLNILTMCNLFVLVNSDLSVCSLFVPKNRDEEVLLLLLISESIVSVRSFSHYNITSVYSNSEITG